MGRTALFVALHDSDLMPSGPGADVLLFTIASTAAALATTPFDVARTKLLLNGGGVSALPATLLDMWREQGVPATMAGWVPRLAWNGIVVGTTLGLCRQGYTDVRAAFLLKILDKLNGAALPIVS